MMDKIAKKVSKGKCAVCCSVCAPVQSSVGLQPNVTGNSHKILGYKAKMRQF